MVGVADHFSKLKAHLVSLLSTLSLLKLFKWILDQILTLLRLKKRRRDAGLQNQASADWSKDFSDADVAPSSAATASSTDGVVSATSSPSHWPVVAFFGIAVGVPYLLWKSVTSSATGLSNANPSTTLPSSGPFSASSSPSSSSPPPPSPSWCHGIGEHFVAKAEFDFRATKDDELSFEKDDLLKVAPKHLQRLSPNGWYLASKDGTAVGYVPANHVQVLVKLQGKTQ